MNVIFFHRIQNINIMHFLSKMSADHRRQHNVIIPLAATTHLNSALLLDLGWTLAWFSLYEKGMLPVPFEQLCSVSEADRSYRKVSKWLADVDKTIQATSFVANLITEGYYDVYIEEIKLIYGPSISCGKDIYHLHSNHPSHDELGTECGHEPVNRNSAATTSRCKRMLIRELITSEIAATQPSTPCRSLFLAIRLKSQTSANLPAGFLQALESSIFMQHFSLRDSFKVKPKKHGRLVDISVNCPQSIIQQPLEDLQPMDSPHNGHSLDRHGVIQDDTDRHWYTLRRPIRSL